MSRPNFLRCVAFVSAMLATAVLIVCVGPVSPDETADLPPSTPLISFTFVAWPLLRAVLSP